LVQKVAHAERPLQQDAQHNAQGQGQSQTEKGTKFHIGIPDDVWKIFSFSFQLFEI
jgi:hypothetical protein